MSSEDAKIETSFADAEHRPIFDHSKLTVFLKQNSFDDLAKAFLAVHLWLWFKIGGAWTQQPSS